MINVLIVDDERNVQKAYRSDIEKNSDRYAVVETLVNAADAMLVCRGKHVDMILMDINTARNENGLRAAKAIKKAMPTIKIILTTSYTDMAAVEDAKDSGMDGFWFKDHGSIELIEVMDMAACGNRFFPEERPEVWIGKTTFNELTAAEQQVLYAMVESSDTKTMAQKLCVEEVTVKKHLSSIYNKVGVRTKADLTAVVSDARVIVPRLKTEE